MFESMNKEQYEIWRIRPETQLFLDSLIKDKEKRIVSFLAGETFDYKNQEEVFAAYHKLRGCLEITDSIISLQANNFT